MRLFCLIALGLLVSRPTPAITLTVTPEVIGTSPDNLGYNIAHFMPDTNVADWWRYSGVNAARVFLSTRTIEPEDDLAPFGDGVDSLEKFMERRKALRSDPTSTASSPQGTPEHLKTPYINWEAIERRYEQALSPGNNRYRVKDTFARLRKLDADILVQITANPSSFPISGPRDKAGLWELWQHYYIQAYYLGKHFDVEAYSMFNEPNHPAAGGITTEDWLLRLRFASDAIQSAIADVNRDHGKHLTAQIHAPTTAGTIDSAFDDWGQPAIAGRHLRIDGTTDPDWSNFHVYSYQYYGMNPERLHSQALTLKSMVRALMSEPPPFAITEFNVRTGANFDRIPDTLDQPRYAAALAADCIALADAGIENLYLFKFGMTSTGARYSDYPVQKNGIHYVDNRKNERSNNYGGITLAGESWRLFNRMAGDRRDRLKVTASDSNESFACIATREKKEGTTHLFLVNQADDELPIEIRADALGLTNGTEIAISEVSSRCYGTIRHLLRSEHGSITPPNASMPGKSVWLVRIAPSGNPAETFTLQSDANAQLRDGHSGTRPSTTERILRASNGSSNDTRHIAVIGFDLNSLDPSEIDSAVLALTATTANPGSFAQAHAYAVTDHNWTEDTLTWSGFSPLRQNVPAGPHIRNNVIIGNGDSIQIQGQLQVNGSQPEVVSIDVTEYLKSQAGKRATFLVAQESRWDTALHEREPHQIRIGDGDLQNSGILIGSRTSASPPVLKIFRRVPTPSVDHSIPIEK